MKTAVPLLVNDLMSISFQVHRIWRTVKRTTVLFFLNMTAIIHQCIGTNIFREINFMKLVQSTSRIHLSFVRFLTLIRPKSKYIILLLDFWELILLVHL